jgi:hypothetical protein
MSTIMNTSMMLRHTSTTNFTPPRVIITMINRR